MSKSLGRTLNYRFLLYTFIPLNHCMKNIFLLGALLISYICHAQTKHDNTIIAHGVNFDSAVIRLMDLGYKIEKIDKDYHTAETNVGKYDVKINIRLKGSDLYITGDIISMHLDFPIEYGWGSKKRWETLMEYASGFAPLEYWKDPKFSAAGQN